MNLVKYDRNRPANYSGFLNNFFNTSLSEFLGNDFVNSTPSINIVEGKDKFIVEVASPGLEKKDFDIQIENDHLVVSATQKSTSENSIDNYTKREFNYSSFKRSFYLPETVDSSKVDASYKEGVLLITLNKKEDSIRKEPREISIK